MTSLLTKIGEEYTLKHNFNNETVAVGLYDSRSDTIRDTSELNDITTEPSSGNYKRQTKIKVTTKRFANGWGFTNSEKITFDVTDTTQEVNSYFLVVNFISEETNDTSSADHLLLVGSLSQSYNLDKLRTFEISTDSTSMLIN